MYIDGTTIIINNNNSGHYKKTSLYPWISWLFKRKRKKRVDILL